MTSATAIAHPNIALIKYWGDLDPRLHIPVNGSISMNLDGLVSLTSVKFDDDLVQDQFKLEDKWMDGQVLDRVSAFLDRVRSMAEINTFATVESHNNFPTGTGIASSASGFAALCLASTKAAGLTLDERALTRLARTGSGSACRSIPSGFVMWYAGNSDQDSFAESVAPPNHWDLADCVVVVDQSEKQTGSWTGHILASTSPLQQARIQDAPRRLDICRNAVLQRDFDALAEVVEIDSNLMHAVMITSNPSLIYWQPETLRVLQAVQSLRKIGLAVCYTIDAGPNVHVLCLADVVEEVVKRMQQIHGVIMVLEAHPGGPAMLKNEINEG